MLFGGVLFLHQRQNHQLAVVSTKQASNKKTMSYFLRQLIVIKRTIKLSKELFYLFTSLLVALFVPLVRLTT